MQSEPEVRTGFEFVCEICCPKARLECCDDHVHIICEDHMEIILKDGLVVASRTFGRRH